MLQKGLQVCLIFLNVGILLYKHMSSIKLNNLSYWRSNFLSTNYYITELLEGSKRSILIETVIYSSIEYIDHKILAISFGMFPLLKVEVRQAL